MLAGEGVQLLESAAVSPAVASAIAPPIAPAIAFLRDHGIPTSALAWASAEARRIDAPADRVLLASGLVTETDFYRALALDRGLAFRTEITARPLTLRAAADDLARAEAAGAIALAQTGTVDGEVEERVALAPAGASLARIQGMDLRGRPDVVMTTPSVLRGSLRAASARWIAWHAVGEAPSAGQAPSAQGSLSAGQFVMAMVLAGLVPFALTLDAHGTFVMLCLLAGPLFVAVISLRLAASLIVGGHVRPNPGAVRDAAYAMPDAALPVYTVLVPLHREGPVLPQLLRALERLDYPPAKLDVKIVIEADDAQTAMALSRFALPPFVEIVIVPDGLPRTKPRALNAALLGARGSLLTVYDAEDVPEPLQLRRAATLFATSSREVVCLQGHLVIDNMADSWLSQCFALEYAALFDVINPGLLTAGLPILLGGTSNHFRTEALIAIGGWDAWNVTEDADLSFRIARAGYRIADLDSTTHEEAPARLRLWMSQRTRWLKGFMQTLATHGRSLSTNGAKASGGNRGRRWHKAVLLALTLSTVISSLFYPVFLAGVAISFLGGPDPADPLSEPWLRVIVFGIFAVGLVSMLLPALIGAWRQDMRQLWFIAPGLPLYYLLVSVAAWRALGELVLAPHHWHKTEHGLAKTSRLEKASRQSVRERQAND